MKRLLISLSAILLVLPPISAQDIGRHAAAPDALEQQLIGSDKNFGYAMGNYYRYWNQARELQAPDKEAAFAQLRLHFQKHPWRIRWAPDAIRDPKRLLELLSAEGTFTDMDPKEQEWRKAGKLYTSVFHNTPDDKVGIFIGDALRRVFLITEAYRTGKLKGDVPEKVYSAILHYGDIELRRSNQKPRFHASCFAIPAAASNIYFSLLKEMDQVETSPEPERNDQAQWQLNEVCKMLQALGLQAWTQPMRRDETDADVVSLARFRNHVWWVGGNALAYRPLLQAAAMFSSVPMVDLLAEVCQKCISNTSQVTFHDAFWTEGFTADGAGWGHGKQCLIWGYPIDGTSSALDMLQQLEGTPWERPLSKENTDALMNFFRGGSWYWYKGWRLPGLDRNSYRTEKERYSIAYAKMLKKVLNRWASSFTEEQLSELRQLNQECDALAIDMEGQPSGNYSGLRWFFNNDDFMRKTSDFHVCINMASYRCDGLESAPQADNYNFTCTDGATLLQRDGDEYFKIMGAWDVTCYPGVTARQGMDRLTPVTNWRGYCSQYNFAAAAHDGKSRGVAGLVFDKMDGNAKKAKDEQDGKTEVQAENAILYGIRAHKSWFFIDDYMVALGAGITDYRHLVPGPVLTTIDQTALENKVWMLQGKKKTLLQPGSTGIPEAQHGRPVWICQEGKFSYCLIPGTEQHGSVILETLPTRWMQMNRENEPQLKFLPEQADVLKITIDHGQQPDGTSYAYAVYLGKKLPAKALKRLPFEVLRNDAQLQAVQAFDGKLIEAVFYPTDLSLVHKKTFYQQEDSRLNGKTAVLETGKHRISTDYPCVLTIDWTGTRPMLHLTDPTMNAGLGAITVTIDGKAYSVSLPQDSRCGDTVAVELN